MTSLKKIIKGEGFVTAGRVRRVWGVKGQLSVDWNNGACPVDIENEHIYLKAVGKVGLDKFTVIVDHQHGSCNVVTLRELTSMTGAEKYKSSDIWVEKDKLPKLKDGEYYSYQLLEMRVETTDGEYLGEISGIFSTGSNDVYVVRNGSKEILIPAIKDVVKKIDIEKKLMTVELIEGLL